MFFPSVDDAKTLEDDAVLLKVIEAYCTSAKTRQTVNSCKYEKNLYFVEKENNWKRVFMIVSECKVIDLKQSYIQWTPS